MAGGGQLSLGWPKHSNFSLLTVAQAWVSALLGALATSTSQETIASISPRSLRGELLRRTDAYRLGTGC
jgi:hypothetical protein